MENGLVEDVLPMEHGNIPASYVSLPEGIDLFFTNHPTKTDQITAAFSKSTNKKPRLLKVSAIQKTDAVVVMGIKRPIVLCITGIWAIPHEASRWERMTRWWFQTFINFTSNLGKIPILTIILFKWVETTNQMRCSEVVLDG